MRTVDPTIILLAIIGVLYLVTLGVILKRRSVREWPVGLLVLYVVVSLLLTLGETGLRLGWPPFLAADVLERVLLHGLLLLSLLFLHVGRSFLRLGGAGWGWWALGVAWMAAAVALNGNLVSLPEEVWAGNGRTLVVRPWTVQRQGLGLGVLVLGWGVFMGGAAVLTVRGYRQTQQPLHRNRITYWSLALGLTVAGGALLFTGRDLLGAGLHLLGVLGVAYVLLTYRLPDVRQMGRQVASYLIIALLTAIIYAGGFLLAEYVLQSVPGYNPLLLGAVLALGLALLLDPLLSLLQRVVSGLISGPGYDPRRTLREYSMSISNILDLERLGMVAVGLISEAMDVRRGTLFVVHYENGEHSEADGTGRFRLRSVRGMGKRVPSGVLAFESPVATYLRLKQHPLTQYDIDLLPRFQRIAPEERAWLDSLDMDVYVPIYAKGEWIGLLGLGPKASGDRYFDDDMTLLSTLADQTAVALQNARLFDDLKARNTENERLNEELTAANCELARLDQAKSDFIDIASHELRTPLTQVQGYSDILGEMIQEQTLVPESGLQMVQGVRKAARRLREIVDLMLDVSQLDTETMVLNAAPTSVGLIMNMAVDNWAASLEERQQTITVEGLSNLPLVTADGKRLKQVFLHLIQNAIKYTPDGGQIRIIGRHLGTDDLPEEQSVEVVVADTGIGIATEDLGRIFQKFYRTGDVMSHSTGRTKFKGAGPGLGLTMARGIVEAHGGRVWAESPGYDEDTCPGSEFHVILPVQPRCLDSIGLDPFMAAVRAEHRQAFPSLQ